jgi:hypothetical protein
MSHRLMRIAGIGLLSAALIVPIAEKVTAQVAAPNPPPATTDRDHGNGGLWGLVGLLGLGGLAGRPRRENTAYRADRPVTTRPGA